MVSRLKNENVVELVGYYVDGPLRVLAYEHASKGSLHDILHGKFYSINKFEKRLQKSYYCFCVMVHM